MGWQAKHLYGVMVLGFLLYLGVGVIFYPPILYRYWVPTLVSLYLLAYLFLPSLRKPAQKRLESPSLQQIVSIMNEVLQQDPALKSMKGEIQSFTTDNAYVRVVSDYVFREFTPARVFDRVKDSIANFYFYIFTAYGFGIVACLIAIGGMIDVSFYLVEDHWLFKPIFSDMPFGVQIISWLAMLVLCYFLYRYFNLLSTQHEQRAVNLNIFVIRKNRAEIEKLTMLLGTDENLKSIAKLMLKVP